MPTFKCKNPECIKHTEMDLEPKVTFIWNSKTQKLESPYDKCPVCGGNRKVFKEEKGFNMPWFKSEDARNYNNKTVRKYDYDYRPSND